MEDNIATEAIATQEASFWNLQSVQHHALEGTLSSVVFQIVQLWIHCLSGICQDEGPEREVFQFPAQMLHQIS